MLQRSETSEENSRFWFQLLEKELEFLSALTNLHQT